MGFFDFLKKKESVGGQVGETSNIAGVDEASLGDVNKESMDVTSPVMDQDVQKVEDQTDETLTDSDSGSNGSDNN